MVLVGHQAQLDLIIKHLACLNVYLNVILEKLGIEQCVNKVLNITLLI